MDCDTDALPVPSSLQTVDLVKVPRWVADKWRFGPPGAVVGFAEPGRQFRLLGNPRNISGSAPPTLMPFKASSRLEKNLLIFRGDAIDDGDDEPIGSRCESRQESVFCRVGEVLTMIPEMSPSYTSTIRLRASRASHLSEPTALNNESLRPDAFGVASRKDHIFRYFVADEEAQTQEAPTIIDAGPSGSSQIPSSPRSAVEHRGTIGQQSDVSAAQARGKMPPMSEDELKRRIFIAFEKSGKPALSTKELLRSTGQSHKILTAALETICIYSVRRSRWSLKPEYDADTYRSKFYEDPNVSPKSLDFWSASRM